MQYLIILLLLFCSFSYSFNSLKKEQEPALKQVVNVVTDAWPPFRIEHPAGGFTGLDIDLLQAISEITDLQFDVSRAPWSRSLRKLKHNQVDMMTGLAYTPARAQYINYINYPYYECHPAFYIQNSLKKAINNYQDLYQYRVGYVLNSSYFEPFDSDTRMSRHGVVTEIQLIKMANKGRLDVFIGTDCQVDYELTKQKLWGKIRKVSYQPEQKTPLYLGISTQNKIPGLADKLNSALIELQKSGQLQVIKNRYFAPESVVE